MTILHRRFIASLLLALASSSTIAQEADMPQGAELLAPFKHELQRALRDGLAAGPMEAIGVCRLQAPEIAASLSRDGVKMGRTSHRLRNPANVSPAWVKPLLDEYLANAADREPRSVELDEGRTGYAEPIITQPLCLTCHGANLSPALSERIAELYPSDRATGFALGDLRGVFWVEYARRL